MAEKSPAEAVVRWHAGEQAIQHTMGADAIFAGLESRIFHMQLSEQLRAFFSSLSLLVIGSVDDRKDVWATVVSGDPGFLSSPNMKTLSIHSQVSGLDPAREGLGLGASVALLGIDFAARRRFRLNGRVVVSSPNQTDVRARQVFGNCPKYIKVRHLVGKPTSSMAVEHADQFAALDEASRTLIEGAETFFVASYVDLADGERQVDVSHRGGPRGFVRVGQDGALTVPDYTGNHFFNTLGNFAVNPRAGLVFADFDGGSLLQLSGDVELVLEGSEIDALPGAERFWRFFPRTVIRRQSAIEFQRSRGSSSTSEVDSDREIDRNAVP